MLTCVNGGKKNLNWLKNVSVGVNDFVVIVYVQEMKFCPCYDFCWKSCFFLLEKFLKYTTQNVLPTKIFWWYVHFAWNCSEEEKILLIFSGRGHHNWS